MCRLVCICLVLVVNTVHCKDYGSLTFVIDDTGSMRSDINQVKEGVGIITNTILSKTSQVKDIILVTFNDPNKSSLEPKARLLLNTTKQHELEQTLQNIHVFGGGDCPEMSLHGVKLGLQSSRPNSLLYVFTDASPKDSSMTDEVIGLAQSLGSQVNFLLTPQWTCSKFGNQPYHDIAKATYGQVFTLDSKTEVEAIIPSIDASISGDRNLITSTVIPYYPDGRWTIIPFDIDPLTDYAVISTSGKKVQLNLVEGPTRFLEKVTWVQNVKIVKLVSPKPGKYKLAVRGMSTTSIMIFGRTDFTFQHGFSEAVPTSLRDTEKQPTEGTKYHLCVSVEDPGHSVGIETAQIQDMDSNLIAELPLQKVSEGFYSTELFEPPNKMFTITVKGTGKTNRQTITRMGKTPIEPLKRKNKPTVNIEGNNNYEFNTKLFLACKVKAYPEPNILWTDGEGNIVPSVTAAINPPYEYVSRIKDTNARRSQSYRCKASNGLGSEHRDVNIDVKSPFTKPENEGTTYIDYEKGGSIDCPITSSYPMNVTWKKEDLVKGLKSIKLAEHNTQHENELKITKMTEDLQGKYVCIATLVEDETVTATYYSTVKIKGAAPEIEMSDTLRVREGIPLTMKCNVVKGYPKPAVKWYFQEKYASEMIPLRAKANEYYFDKTELRNNGFYTCTAENSIDRASHTMKLSVESPPKLKLHVNNNDNETVTVDYGSSPNLQCEVRAFPPPQVVWTDGKGRQIESQQIKTGPNHKYISSIQLSEFKKADTYRCIATNVLGKEFKSVQISAASPFIETADRYGLKHVDYGKEAILECNTMAKLPYKITWTKMVGTSEEEIKNSDKFDFLDTKADKYTLKINAMDKDLEGKYKCKVKLNENNAVSSEFIYDVKVSGLVAPKIEKQRPVIKTKEGKPIIIKCTIVQGVPKPTTKWLVKYQGAEKYQSLVKNQKDVNINSVKLEDVGSYKCIAENEVGKDEQEVQLIVEAPPKIHSENKTYTAVEGDLVLRIPCAVTGYPKPDVVWKINVTEEIEIRGGKYSIEEGALLIHNPHGNDENLYTCEAKNEFGKSEITVKGVVTSFVTDEEMGNISHVCILKGQSKKVRCPYSGDVINWYKEWIYHNVTGALNLKHATFNDSGNYTCRASSQLGTKAHSFVVDVTNPPRFENSYHVAHVDWDGDNQYLDCLAVDTTFNDGIHENVEWTLNGRKMKKTHYMQLNIHNWGNYTCKISNCLGHISRSFYVTSSNCLIKAISESSSAPLLRVVDEVETWPEPDLMKEYITLEKDQRLRLSCNNQPDAANYFKMFPEKSDIIATCDHEDEFEVSGRTYKFSDLVCEQEVKPAVIETGQQCLGEDSELIKVGFNSSDSNELYEVCFDNSKKVPLYTKMVMPRKNFLNIPRYNWRSYPQFGEDKEELYSCKEGAGCCFAKSQLVNVRDVKPGVPRAATYVDRLNSVPIWRPCDKSTDLSWKAVEESFRSALDSNSNPDTVWTGASEYYEANGHWTPKYLWKVVELPVDTVAVVHVNGPSNDQNDICYSTLCSSYGLLSDRPTDGTGTNTYCCQIDEFSKSFNIPRSIFSDGDSKNMVELE